MSPLVRKNPDALRAKVEERGCDSGGTHAGLSSAGHFREISEGTESKRCKTLFVAIGCIDEMFTVIWYYSKIFEAEPPFGRLSQRTS